MCKWPDFITWSLISDVIIGVSVSAEEQLHEDLAKASLKQHDQFQQVEAANRWKELELQTPDHDLTALNHKMALVNTKAQPKVFHDHENKYREERAGLYNTSYNPPQPHISSSEIFDTSRSHKDALNLDVNLNGDMHDAIRYNRTLGGNGSVPQLHGQPTPYETVEPFNISKLLQKNKLQPTNPDFKVQEGHVNLKDSTYGREFNTPQFLQEREMPTLARQEPSVLMSHQNQLLDNARMVSRPSQSASCSINAITSEACITCYWRSNRFKSTKNGTRYSLRPAVLQQIFLSATGNLHSANEWSCVIISQRSRHRFIFTVIIRAKKWYCE